MLFSILIISFISFFFVAASAILHTQTENLKKYWFEQSWVVIFLCTDFESKPQCPQGEITLQQTEAISSQIKSPALAAYVKEVRYESSAEAYSRLVEEQDGRIASNLVNEDQLNGAFWVKLSQPDQGVLIMEAVQDLPGITYVQDQTAYFRPIVDSLDSATIGAAGVALITLTSASLLIATTIRLSALERRKELEIMRLVGASRASIQIPFIAEGVVATTAGATGALVASGFVLNSVVGESFANVDSSFVFVGVAEVLNFAPMLLASSAFFAATVSYFATLKHVRT